ncbi:low molecular weight protein-tyrosine-phosphatase [Marixanthomonas spongiae]|uniref:protein-tyrosine-phosphatase n=1 Tax=Marixanthomonas spongiae TaxID=2174845 RepID=A0A2U0I5Y5_9FLAO|nr:low molecular weight protein-tyrosine-phosphatase [Marixanthomonas spongiae]PVW16518.1 protein-tyrosine-phosphatase [Marixanthomonas spongiae]
MKTKILMVCLGNICRSPLAEGLLKAKVDPDKVYVTSAGTGHWHVGEQPDPRSIAVAKKNNLDITDQRGRQFKAEDFNEFDHIFVMDNSNKENVLKLAKTEADRKKVQLILDEIFPGENVDVPDPYYGGDSGFDRVYDMLNQACQSIANRI